MLETIACGQLVCFGDIPQILIPRSPIKNADKLKNSFKPKDGIHEILLVWATIYFSLFSFASLTRLFKKSLI